MLFLIGYIFENTINLVFYKHSDAVIKCQLV